MPRLITVGLNPDHAAMWRTTWPQGRLAPEWAAEERRMRGLSLATLLGLDPGSLDDWQRCLVGERLVRAGRPEDARRFLARVGGEARWHPAVAYLDVFDAVRDGAEPDDALALLERAVVYARAVMPADVTQATLELAEELCARGEVDRALRLFAERLRADALNPWPYWFLATGLARAHRSAWAAASLRRGLEVLQATGDRQSLARQFREELDRLAAERGSGPEPAGAPLPEPFPTLFASPLPSPPPDRRAARGPRGAPPAPGPRPGAAPAVGRQRKVGRNEPCPCGSGKKYKHCHGR